jgi:hypothetical protein
VTPAQRPALEQRLQGGANLFEGIAGLAVDTHLRYDLFCRITLPGGGNWREIENRCCYFGKSIPTTPSRSPATTNPIVSAFMLGPSSSFWPQPIRAQAAMPVKCEHRAPEHIHTGTPSPPHLQIDRVTTGNHINAGLIRLSFSVSRSPTARNCLAETSIRGFAGPPHPLSCRIRFQTLM